MTFSHLSLLPVLAPLVLVPLVIHLLNRRFPHWQLFSSIELIKKSLAQRSQLMRWRHWLLTLVRTLLLAACVAAFLGPMLAKHGQPAQPAAKRQVIVVIDHSYSMEVPEGGVTLRGRALVEASRIVDSLSAVDEVNVLAVGRDVSASFTAWSSNVTAARTFIKGLGVGYERADFHKALDLVSAQVRGVKTMPEVYLISDFQRTNWADANFASLPKNVRLFFVNISGNADAARENHAITHAEITSTAVLAGGEVALQISVANHSAAVVNDVIESVMDGAVTAEAPVTAQPWSVRQLSVRLRAPGPGWHTVDLRLKTADAMPLDDVFHLPLFVQEQEEVVLASDDEGESALTLRFLDAAINPFADKRGSMQTRRVKASALDGKALALTSKVVLSRVAKLGEAQVRALADFMKAGGGVLYFMDGAHDGDNLAALAEWFTQADAIPLRLSARTSSEQSGGEPSQIAKGLFESRYLRLFRGTARESLAQLNFYERWHARPQERANVLLTYADGSPALAQGSPGLGNLLLCNFSVAEVASNLARQRVFPAWIQELVAQLSGERAITPHSEPGDLMSAEVWSEIKSDFVGPAGQPVAVSRVAASERVLMQLQALEPGFYVLRDAKKKVAHVLAANVAPPETDLRVLDSQTPQQHASADSVAGAYAVDGGVNYAELANGQPMFHWFVIAALAVLLAESLLQTKLRRRTP